MSRVSFLCDLNCIKFLHSTECIFEHIKQLFFTFFALKYGVKSTIILQRVIFQKMGIIGEMYLND